jgi:GNAT superfamily N-acetyltransferase
MDQASDAAATTIRPAVGEDADGIARTFVDSAAHHASLDPERYAVPAADMISARYREGQQHPPESADGAVTLVAEVGGEIVGFVDARLEQSPDPMHREMTYCQISEIAVSGRHRNRGVGGDLIRAAEDWGRRQGATFAALEYHIANVRAGAFYQERMGYRPAAVIAIKRL